MPSLKDKENNGSASSTFSLSGGSSKAHVGDSTLVSSNAQASSVVDPQIVLSDFALSHPSAHLSRKTTTEIERQNINVNSDYGESIDLYVRQLEEQFLTTNCLMKHKVTPVLRARMVDWMIEVLTNFKCDD